MNPSTLRRDRLQRLRKLCLALPETSEQEAWGDPTWRVRGKIFAMQKGNVAGHRPSLWLKVPDGARALLLDGDPARYFVPPYVGSKGWVGVYLDGRSVDWAAIAGLVEQSWRCIAPKRLSAKLE